MNSCIVWHVFMCMCVRALRGVHVVLSSVCLCMGCGPPTHCSVCSCLHACVCLQVTVCMHICMHA